MAHAVAAGQRGGGYVEGLSRRQGRHVYARGLRVRRRFVMTIGNTVNGVGLLGESNPRRRRLVTDHEDVHVWQSRWFGPLFPLLYGGWMVVGAVVGAALWVIRGRRVPLARAVETCAYFLNPFERWAYSRDDHWPHRDMAPGFGSPWRPAVPLSEATSFRRFRRPRT